MLKKAKRTVFLFTRKNDESDAKKIPEIILEDALSQYKPSKAKGVKKKKTKKTGLKKTLTFLSDMSIKYADKKCIAKIITSDNVILRCDHIKKSQSAARGRV